MKTIIKKHYKIHKETIHNIIWRALQTFGKQGITFLIFIFCGRLLTPYDFGLYNYALAIILFLILFGDFGISAATSKYVAEYHLVSKKKLRLLLFNSGVIIFGLTILISLLTLILGKAFLGDKYIYFLLLLPLLFFAPMTSLYDGIYRGLKKFKSLAIISIISGILSLSFIDFLIKKYGLIGALLSQNLFYLILFIALAAGYREFDFKIDKEIMKKISRYSLIVGLADISSYLFIPIVSVILGMGGYITSVGYYEIINKTFLIFLIPFTIFAQVIAPNITSLNVKNKNIDQKFVKYTLGVLALSSLLTLLMFFFMPAIINILFDKYNTQVFSNIFLILIWIFPARAIITFISNGFITPTGHAKILVKQLLIFGVINTILSIIFLHLWGAIGPAGALLLANIFYTIFIFFEYRNLIRGIPNK